jgi:1,4-alpha-glucan branching enzyme
MERTHDEGLFICSLPLEILNGEELLPYNYQYEVHFKDGNSWTTNDPYRFEPLLGEQDRFLYNKGTNYKIYDHLGAHLLVVSDVKGTVFRVWAPNAQAVSVLGYFNSWDRRIHQMRSLGISGIWELFIPGLDEGEVYKFSVLTQNDEILEKADPFQFFGELRPDNGSITIDLNDFTWTDQKWQENKTTTNPYENPLSIYEVHPGSWQRDPQDPDRFLTFLELSEKLIPYVKEMGFTHIELLPVMEHPLDESWGYQVTAPFSVTSRYGTPKEFQIFVDRCHNNGIGVILDWVPAHFPKDSHSLGNFDGTSLYEHSDPRRGSHPEWGTYIYNYGRNEVSNYLIANALFWLSTYHIDGLRVDAVASMLYLDYARNEGEWLPNASGGRENIEAIEFIRHLNSVVYEKHPHCLMIAEESTSFYGVSHPADKGGLGFGLKWNMGWMNDILTYFQKDPIHRKFHHNHLTFSIMYAFSENFILPLSHDEVVHGKKSLLDKMPGDWWQKFANQRLLLLFMWTHPGKKLLFMGMELGQMSEWYCKRSLDWHLLKNVRHAELQHYFKELNNFYRVEPALWQLDCKEQGFKWLDLQDRDNSVISFIRRGRDREDDLICILNFTPQRLTDYKTPVPEKGEYRVVFCTDKKEYGGSGAQQPNSVFTSIKINNEKSTHQMLLTLPALGGLILKKIPSA